MNDDDDMKIDEVIAFIMNAGPADLKVLNQALRDAYAMNQHEAKARFKRGDKVKFTSTKTGQDYTGTVVKVNRKTIHVSVEVSLGRMAQSWRVPPTMLQKV